MIPIHNKINGLFITWQGACCSGDASPAFRRRLIFSAETQDLEWTWQCACYGFWEKTKIFGGRVLRMLHGSPSTSYFSSINRQQTIALLGPESTNQGEVGMKESSIRLGPREQQIAELLLQGCDNAEIARQLKMARRTVKAHFNRLFLRFAITGGIKRVKLATILYRRQLCSESSVTETAYPASASSRLRTCCSKAATTRKLPGSSRWPGAR